MLKDLLIQNLILMESCSIAWDPKLSAITGETGSGKTAILHGLRLLLGQKLDTSLIRRGESKGFIQARFEFPFPKDLTSLLQDAGVPIEDSNLILSREISSEGKSKSWINERYVSLSFLQKVGSYCVQIVDQDSCGELRHSDIQREALDCFGSLTSMTASFSKLFIESKELGKEIEKWEECARQKERELSFCLEQLDELSAVDVEDGDEEKIFQEYDQVSKAEDVSLKIDSIFELISQSPSSLLSKVQQAKTLCKPFASLHKAFEESLELLDSASVSFQEVLHLLRNALSDFDPDPKRKEMLDNKLSFIDRMKKKYGPSVKDWKEHASNLKEKIALFDAIEEKMRDAKVKAQEIEKKLQEQALSLSEKRKQAALDLGAKLSHEIQSLNMSGASLEIKVEPQARSLSGENAVHFWLAANKGENTSLVKDSTSGGELARLLLALKLCLAEKNHTPTLVFDEVDSGVGGETARLIGEKLKKLSTHRQIICITHFPQVACAAHMHLRVEKRSAQDRTHATVRALSADLREAELLRMLGGKKTLSLYTQS